MEKEDSTLYETLGIDVSKQDVLSLTEKDISSAYRKSALRWHPDKNRDNANATSKFSQLVLAYDTLSSSTKREAYNEKIRHVRARQKAFDKMDVTRRRLRQQLHERELQAAQQQQQQPQQHRRYYQRPDDSALSKVQKEIDRLRKEAMREEREREKEQKKTAARSSSMGSNQKEQSSNKSSSSKKNHADDLGIWESIPGFSEFQSKNSSISFEQFEQAVLEGRDPFPK